MAAYLWVILGCFFTAWMGQFAHILRGEGVDWRVVALARTTLALVFSLVLARMAGAKLVFWHSPALWIRGVASSISLLCSFYAFSQLNTSEVLTLTNTFPIWVAFLSWPLLREKPSRSVWLAAAFGVVGVALIQAPHFGDSTGDHPAIAVALSLVAALTNAIAMLGLHRLKGIDPWAIVVHYSGVATLFVCGAMMIGGWPELSAAGQGKALALLLAVGVAATLGQVCITLAFTSGPPARVSVVGLTQVLFALILDLIFEGPTLKPITMAGIALVLAPTAWVMAGPRSQVSDKVTK